MPTSALDPTHVPRVATRRGGILGSSWRNGVLSSCLKTWHHSGCAQALARWQLLVRKPVIGGCLGSRDGALETLHEPPGINLHCNGAPGACAYHPAALLAAARPPVHRLDRAPACIGSRPGCRKCYGHCPAHHRRSTHCGSPASAPDGRAVLRQSWKPLVRWTAVAGPRQRRLACIGGGAQEQFVPHGSRYFFFFLHVYKQTSFTISAIPLPPRRD